MIKWKGFDEGIGCLLISIACIVLAIAVRVLFFGLEGWVK